MLGHKSVINWEPSPDPFQQKSISPWIPMGLEMLELVYPPYIHLYTCLHPIVCRAWCIQACLLKRTDSYRFLVMVLSRSRWTPGVCSGWEALVLMITLVWCLMVEQIRVYSAPVHLDVLVAIFFKKNFFLLSGPENRTRIEGQLPSFL